MEALALLCTVTVIHLLAVMSPGPDFVVACRNALIYSRKTGIYTAVGFALGIGVHILYCVAGLAVVISQSIILFSIIKYAGALYLLYIGYKSIFSKHNGVLIEEQQKQVQDISMWAAIKMGFLTNVLNPKATLFFLSLFTLVISPNTSPAILGVLSLIMMINTALWFSLVAIFLTQKKVRGVFLRFQKVFDKIFGGILILFGVKVAFTHH